MDPTAVAILDDNMYIVESIIKHRKNGINSLANLELYVKWLGYPEPTWEPATNLRDNAIFHEYCRRNRLISLIPAKYKS